MSEQRTRHIPTKAWINGDHLEVLTLCGKVHEDLWGPSNHFISELPEYYPPPRPPPRYRSDLAKPADFISCLLLWLEHGRIPHTS